MKMQRAELANGGRDARFAIRIPELMHEFGLHNVGVRMNDCVKFVTSDELAPGKDTASDVLSASGDWGMTLTDTKKRSYVISLIERGLSEAEVECFVAGESKIGEHLRDNRDSVYIVQAPCTLISYGTK